MGTYKVLKPIGWSGRRERGEVIEMTEAEASAFGPDYLEPIVPKSDTEDAGGELPTKEEIAKLKKPDVIAVLEKLGIAFDESASVGELRDLLTESLPQAQEDGDNKPKTDEGASA